MRRVVAVMLLLGCGGGDEPGGVVELDATAETAASDSTATTDSASEDSTTIDSTEIADSTAVDSTSTDSTAVDTSKPDAPCTPCGASCCTATQACIFGMCLDCGGMLACDGGCVDHQNNPEHCGACGNKCGASQVCVAGVCASSCASGKTACSGWCRDAMSDPNHCGGCDKACPVVPGSSLKCAAGVCGFECYSGYADCNKTASDGCEVRTSTSHQNCGACGTPCSATEVCTAGACTSGRYVFVTKTRWPGALGGYAGADAKCQAAATAGGLPGTYLAWMNVPATRFAKATVPYVLPSGSLVASNWGDLVDETLMHAINVDEFGTSVMSSAQAWSDADAKGLSFLFSKNCSTWTHQFAPTRGSFGQTDKSDVGWAGRLSQDSECSAMRHLYCFQQ